MLPLCEFLLPFIETAVWPKYHCFYYISWLHLLLTYANISLSAKKTSTLLGLSSVYNYTEFVWCIKSFFCTTENLKFSCLMQKGSNRKLFLKPNLKRSSRLNITQVIYWTTSSILNVCPLSKCIRVQDLRCYFHPSILCNVFHSHLFLSCGFH